MIWTQPQFQIFYLLNLWKTENVLSSLSFLVKQAKAAAAARQRSVHGFPHEVDEAATQYLSLI
jgi:hypothetical protein